MCVFIVVFQDWQPPFACDVRNFRFTPRVQRLNELEVTFINTPVKQVPRLFLPVQFFKIIIKVLNFSSSNPKQLNSSVKAFNVGFT